jgi:TonB-linked SusC/RagA family outer membrane protein
VSGIVTATDGQPIVGASVEVKGTTIGVTTGINGDYDIQSPPEATLVFSFMGYAKKEEALAGRTRVDVTLDDESQQLSEVVVIGYGVQRKEAVTGSVASIGGAKMMEVASTNVTQALQGRVAGVEMTQTSSKPGAEMQIRIRGTRSLSASNDPLVVLDGIPFAGSFNDIDPSSIKSIDILKDASATAIYGSRGANGVILITTIGSGGIKDPKVQVSYSGYYGVKDLFARYPMMDGAQFATLRKEADRTIDELGRGAKWPYSSDEADGVNTDWQDMFFQKGMVSSHNVNVAKGSETGSYTFGVGYYKEAAVVPTQQYSRLNLRTAIDQNVGKYLRFGLTSNNSYGLSEGNQVGVDGALGASPLANPYDDEGNLKRATKSSSTDVYKVWTKDLIEEASDVWLSETKSLASYNNLYGEVKIPGVEGLAYRVNVGLNVRATDGGSFTGIGVTNATDPNAQSSASINHSLRTNWAVENLLTYDRTFADKHRINVVGLYSAEQTKYNSSDISVRNLPADHFQYYNLGFGEGEITIDKNNQAYAVSGLMSWMGRAMYSYDDRYMLSATFRSDASSRLAPGHQWHTYPAVSAGWNIHREAFMGNPSWLEQLKLRIGYGETSNQAVDPYKTLGLLNTRPYNFGDNGESSYKTGYYISELPNENLGWEYTTTWNYGLDFAFFKGRLRGTIEYYTQHTKDILLSVDLPSTTGVPSYMANIGETKNNGFELSLSGTILDNYNGWTWDVGVNLYSNHNELVALTSGQDKNEGNWWFVGSPINVIYDYEKIGLWQAGEEALMDIQEPGGNAGMIKVKGGYYLAGEELPDGKSVGDPRAIGSADRQIIEMDPKFQGGFNTRVAYKGFDLNIVGAFKSGGTLISTIYGGTSYLNNLTGRHGNVDVDYWTPENTGAAYPRPGGILSADGPKYANTLAYFDASYLKIRAITLGYEFNPQWTKRVGVDKLRIYATVQNPFVLFSPYYSESGMDPETNSFGEEFQAIPEDNAQFQSRLAIVGYNTPSTRNYLFGLNITF